ncbi:unnamed protein product [Acanthoscelides obtectus]|nr:unnamed protein product [Acanthoscelides obtectus]CAK1633882.1 Probable ATP-dependent RNA helicase DDX20 [Acanthoscelides obtectus]
MEGLKVESFIGGTPLQEDKDKCNNCHIVVGTPGRIKHLINNGVLKSEYLSLFILDEADKLMEDSFLSDINEIYNSLPSKKQIITASATYPNSLEKYLSEYMVSPTFITAELGTPLLLGLKQFVSIVDKPGDMCIQICEKVEELRRILSTVTFTQCLVFFNYQRRTQSITNVLNRSEFQATCIHAHQTQPERLAAVNNFKSFKCRILLSTDLTARGIDAANVDLVINFDIPTDAMTYLHRMGRAGRYGSTGACINITLIDELEVLQKILGCIGGSEISIPKLPEFAGSIQDLLRIEVPPENCISGIVSETPTSDIRSRINDLKKGKHSEEMKQKNIHKAKKAKKQAKQNIDKKQDNNSLPMSVSSKNESNKSTALPSKKANENQEDNVDSGNVENLKKQVSEVGNSEILASLASGTFQFKTKDQANMSRDASSNNAKKNNDVDFQKFLEKRMAGFNRESILDSLVSDAFQFNATPKPNLTVPEVKRDTTQPFEEKKNVRSPTSSNEFNKQCQKKQKLEDTYCKNKALLDITKILINPDSTKPEETSLQACLDTLKLNEKVKVTKFSEKDTAEILDVIKSDRPISDEEETKDSKAYVKENVGTSSQGTESVDVERVLEIAFNTIVRSTNDNLEECLEKLQKKTGEPENVNESVSMVVNDGLSEDSKETDPGPVEIMKWVPVKPGKNDQSRSRQMSNAEQDTTLWVLNQNQETQEDENSHGNLDGENEQYDCNNEVVLDRWEPVEDSTSQEYHRQYALQTAHRDIERYDRFQQYFDVCSESLWNNGLRFGDVTTFDEWFCYEWEAQLYEVRNYVQQNVYLDEMNRTRHFNR